MRKYWIAISLTAVALLAAPVIAAQAAQVSVPPLLTEILTRLEKIEERLETLEERRLVLDRLNCEVAENKNPEPERYHEGYRVYTNYETAVACLFYRNPPGHLYEAPPGHVNPPGHTHFTSSTHRHAPPKDEALNNTH